jgi:hypothetical protein
VTPIPRDAHEWLSFEDTKRERTWMFDVTFLESNWTCIFGNGCQGVLTGPTPELVQGCCSYGAHFSDEKDQRRVEKAAKRLTADQWQFKAKGKNGTTRVKKNGEIVTRLVQDACIFLNRPDFHRGPGCALHVMAIDNKESYIPFKPEVCWQLPLRRDDEVQDDGHVITRISQWDRATGDPVARSFTGGAPSRRRPSSARPAWSTRCAKNSSPWSANRSTTRLRDYMDSAPPNPRPRDSRTRCCERSPSPRRRGDPLR